MMDCRRLRHARGVGFVQLEPRVGGFVGSCGCSGVVRLFLAVSLRGAAMRSELSRMMRRFDMHCADLLTAFVVSRPWNVGTVHRS